MSELRVTDTNSANDSKGRAFGLEGNDFMYVLVAIVAAIGFYLVLNLVLRIGFGVAFAMAVPIFLGPLAWVLFLRHNKPAGFAEDWFDQISNKEGWSFAARTQPVLLESERH